MDITSLNLSTLVANLIPLGLTLLKATAIVIIGLYVARFVQKLLSDGLSKTSLDASLAGFAASLLYYGILIFVGMAALQTLGVATTSFVAVLGAAGLAIGLAMEGALGNFAAGVLLIFFRPFKVGDYVEIAGAEGTVEELQIFNTVLNSLDNETIIIPNAQITAEKITNYTAKDYVRIEVPFTVDYDTDLKQLNALVMQVPERCSRVLADPKPELQVIEFTDRGLKVQAEVSVAGPDREDGGFEVGLAIKELLDEANIKLPYNQLMLVQA